MSDPYLPGIHGLQAIGKLVKKQLRRSWETSQPKIS